MGRDDFVLIVRHRSGLTTICHTIQNEMSKKMPKKTLKIIPPKPDLFLTEWYMYKKQLQNFRPKQKCHHLEVSDGTTLETNKHCSCSFTLAHVFDQFSMFLLSYRPLLVPTLELNFKIRVVAFCFSFGTLLDGTGRTIAIVHEQ